MKKYFFLSDRLKEKKYIKCLLLTFYKSNSISLDQKIFNNFFGFLIAMEGGLFKLQHFELLIRIASRYLKFEKAERVSRRLNERLLVKRNYNKKPFKFFFTVNKFASKKPSGQRMGTGKGEAAEWIIPIKKGQLLFSIHRDIRIAKAKVALRQMERRAPLQVKYIIIK